MTPAMMRGALALVLCLGLGFAQRAEAQAQPGFAIRLVSEGEHANADRFPNFVVGLAKPGERWVERSGGIEGELTGDVRVVWNPDAGAGYVVYVSLSPKGTAQLTEITRNNIGRTMAVIVQGRVLVTGLMNGVLTSGDLQLAGESWTEDEANIVANAIKPSIGKNP